MFEWLIDWLEALAQNVDPALFVFIGSFIVGIVAPIPSPLIMATTAALAHSLQLSSLEILWILLVAAGSKTLSSLLVYWLAFESEHLLVGRFGKYVGLSTEMIEGVGRWVGKGYWDELVLLLLRSLPIVPSIVVSAACGVFKIDLRTYLWTTFVGTFIRNGIFFSILYFGWSQAEVVWNLLDDRGELIALAAIALAGAAWLAWQMKGRIEAKVLGTGGKTEPSSVGQTER